MTKKSTLEKNFTEQEEELRKSLGSAKHRSEELESQYEAELGKCQKLETDLVSANAQHESLSHKV